jgi:predicted HicB family RNase H-like nuclease
MRQTTVRLPDELYCELAKYAKENDLSWNQSVKKAVRELLNRWKGCEHN